MRVCVFAGSAAGISPAYAAAARALGEGLGLRGHSLIYGGSASGLMGLCADAALAAGAAARGVVPRGLLGREAVHDRLTELVVVDSLHERKERMHALSDAFVALPGGAGTLDELLEAFTWRLLGLHHKPLALLDVGGYWQPLLALLRHGAAQGFVAPRALEALPAFAEAAALLDWLSSATVRPAGAARGGRRRPPR